MLAEASEHTHGSKRLPMRALGVFSLALWLGLNTVANCAAQEPLQLSNRQIEELKRAGDRLAD
ncbi:MAG: hypothetical protein AB8B50_15520, partial [Pirellulaceae bacterium]